MRHARFGLALAGLAVGLAAWGPGCLFAPDDCDDLLKCPEKGAGGGSSTGMGGASGGGASTSTIASMSTGTGGGVACEMNSDCTTGTMPSCDPLTHTCISCSDKIQNGSETTVDCGGSCKECDGAPCAGKGDCISDKCFDGVCCATDCNTICQACNLPASPGVCSYVPIGLPDNGCTSATQACNGAGFCKKAPGVACGSDSECASNACFAGICRIENGGACQTDGVTCASGRCVGNKCADCAAGNECSSMACNAPTCKAPGGAPCEADGDCAGSKCQLGFCLVDNGIACGVSADCKSGVCAGGLCVQCGPSACPGGATCGQTPFGASGTCLRPAGAYCTSNTQCHDGAGCTGFPTKCQ